MINENIKRVCVEKCHENLKLVTSDIQKDIVSACAIETTNSIIKDLGDSLFSILVDEARDVSNKEQMAVVICYVDKLGHVVERLLGITHVPNTTATSLKEEIEALLAKHTLSISRLRGQGYDGASNMQGEFNGLKALILKENEYAYYVNCFAHQLHLALVGVAKKNMNISDLFFLVTNVINVVGGSCKRHDILQEIQLAKIKEALENGELSNGQGLNQETTLKRVGIHVGAHTIEHCKYRVASMCGMFESKYSFYAFDKEKLIRLSKFYLKGFPEVQYSTKELDNQLETYILDMRFNTHFVNLKGIGDLAEKMVEKGKHVLYPLVYKLITLVLILPVATATIERALSAMKILKNRLRNRMSNQFMADCLIPYSV
ncbi:uncharacterized protein LOC143857398 [Tasmannia lanceolata]|uniref:uncharacterized protein LOC143857398 n=1 Tax=Tasmannia lanceolata TaxID=3420 RepID=UPI004062BF5A